MASSPWVMDVSEADFEQQVLERSQTVPVVVDFWAPWCGPCRALGPLLESLADESAGGFVVAKVNVDENPNLAGEFNVSGIPAVFAIRNGNVIDGFAGMMPESNIRAFLSGLTPSPADELANQGLTLEATDIRGAEESYRSALAHDPTHEAARVGLARVLLVGEGREDEAQSTLQNIDSGPHREEAERLRRILGLRVSRHDDASLNEAEAAVRDVNDADSHFRLGQVLASRGEYPRALESLLAAAQRDKKLAANEVRELMVSIFQIIGIRSELADEYRDQLRSLLY